MMTSDEYPAYATAIEEVFSEPVPAPARRKPGRPRVVPERRLPEDVIYATVHKHRENGRVIAVEQRQVFGTPEGLEDVLGESAASHRVNTSFVERQNGDRPGPQREEGAEDLSVQQGLAGPRGDDLPDAVQLQLLLVRPDAAGQGRAGALAGAVAGDWRPG